VLVSTVTLVLLFGSINFYWVRRETTNALAGELETRAVHHALGLAIQAVEAMLVEDRLRLARLVEETKSSDPEIAYVFLVGPNGELVADTFGDGFPVELLTANQLPLDRDYMVRRIVDKQGRERPMRDVVAAIAGGYAGFVHVGLKEDLILSGVDKVGKAVTGMVSVLILLGIAASLVFARIVTRPLERLAAVSRRVNLEMPQGSELSLAGVPAKSPSAVALETEVDRLAEEFQQMVSRISTAYEQLRKTQDQLVFADRLSTVGTIAAGLAHELNNPLAGLRNCLRRIQREPENREQLVRYGAMMQESVERMQRVLHGLLDLAKPRRPEIKAVSLKPLLERVIMLAGHQLTKARIVPHVEIAPGASVGNVDEHLLEQALLNLVLNAGDSLAQRVQIDPAFTPQLALRTLNRDGRLFIEVQDNGVGVPQEILQRLFDPFFTTKGPGQGTGLGLSIARDVMSAHGGDVLVESQAGGGATFTIVLPAPGETKEA
jgi:two-component system NtrC family sensor kinase